MADFNALQAIINAYIKRNGVQAITGQILNGVLTGMVNALGKGYTVAGAASPTTDPGTMTGPLAYIAYTAGTYTHFDNIVVEQGEVSMLIYNEAEWHKEVLFSLAAQATVDDNIGVPSVGVSFVDGILTFNFRNMKGEPGENGQDGDPAGFGTISASISGGVGTPGVSVQSSGPDTAKNIAFQFTNLKGETGVTSCVVTVDNTTGNPSCAVSLVGQELHLDFSGLKGAQGDTGSSVDYPFTIVNNLTTDDATQALSAAMGVQLESEVSQLEAKVEGNIIFPNKHIETDGTLSDADGVAVTDFIPVTPNTNYTWFSGIRAGAVIGRLVKYNSSKVVTGTLTGSYGLDAGYTFNTSANDAFVRFDFATINFSFLPQFKQGSTIIWERRFSDLSRIDSLEQKTSDNEGGIGELNVLIKGNVIKRGYFIDANGNESIDENYGVSDFIPMNVGSGTFTWYSGSDNPNSGIRLAFYDKDKQKTRVVSQDSSQSIQGYNMVAYYRVSVYLGAETAWVKMDDVTVWSVTFGELYSIKTRLGIVEEKTTPNVEIGYYLDSGGNKVSNQDYGITDFIPVSSSTQYLYFAAQPSGKLGKLIVYAPNKTAIRTYYSDYGIPFTITTPTNSGYIRMSVGLGEDIPYLKQGDTIIWERYLDTRKQSNSNAYKIKALEEHNDTYSNLDSTIETAIKEYRNKVCRYAKDFALNFGFVTDVHLTSSGAVQHLKRLYTMAKYGKSSPVKFLLFGGDFVSGENTVALDMETMLNGKEAFKDNFELDCFMVRGNHDGSHKNWKSIVDGGGHPTYDDEISNRDWYNMMVSSLDGIVIDQANPLGGYFYKDFPNEKIRLIVLNCYDMTGTDADGNAYNAMYSRASIRQAQATWLATKALDFSDKGIDKANWGIVVTSHDGVDADNSAFGDGAKIELMLQAFKKGEQYEWTYSYNSDQNYYVYVLADFREQGPMNYYALIHGHTHTDRVIFQDGVPHISSGADHPDITENLPSGATLPIPRTLGAVSEYLWDTASVGKEMVCMFRFGAVENGKTSGDRYIHLGANEVAVGGTITLTPTKVSGSLTWGIYSVSSGYYVPVVNGVEGVPVGTPTNHATISNGVVTGVSEGYATAFAQDEDGNKEFFGINVTA